MSRWQLTAVQIELKPFTAIPASRCDDERGLLLWATQATEEAREMGPRRRVWSLEKGLAEGQTISDSFL